MISLYTRYDIHNQIKTMQNVDKHVEKLETSYIRVENRKWLSDFGK